MASGTTADLGARLALYLVADPDQTSRPLEDVVEDALAGGVTAVQLRAKSLPDRDVLWYARRLRDRCTAAGALFIINDRIDIALASGADGVHVGVGDLPVEDARALAGGKLIIGYSPETDEQGVSAADWGADYLGVGPVYGTATKTDAGDAIGLVTLGRRAHRAGIPVVGIGGITAANAAAVIEAGAEGVAVVSAILRADDARRAAADLAGVVRQARADR